MHSLRDFDPLKALCGDQGTDSLDGATVFSSLSDFENHLSSLSPEVLACIQKARIEAETGQWLDHSSDESSSSNCCELSLEPIDSSDSDILEDNVVSKRTVAKKDNQQRNSSLFDQKRKNIRTVLYKIDNDLHKGPLALLCKCLRENLRIKVFVRGRCRLRSIITCYLTSFDKFWNLSLRDADELYYKPKSVQIFRKSRIAADYLSEKFESLYGMYASSFKYISVDKSPNHFEWVKRHVEQLFVRGEDIILISVVK